MLKYIDTQGRYIPNVPARDLSDAEVLEYGEKKLLDSGLYAKPKIQKAKNGETVTEAHDDNNRRN
jgi:hypothetical protein